MSTLSDNNKRIAKNTIYLYIRMLISLVVSLFTTRIILQALGMSDYGIYNVVGGFVAMFTFFNSVLQSGTRRYITLYLGKGNFSLLKDAFTTSMYLHLIISIVIFVLAETVGLWFLNTQLTIDPTRLNAANCVYQFSIISTVLTVMQTPFVSSVTAHEKFDIYAYMSISDVALKLVIVYLLLYIPGDKLIVYSLLTFSVNLINLSIYKFYCSTKFEECVLSFHKNKEIYRSMLHFSGWSALGNLSAILNSQGANVVTNIFFGTMLNAARGISETFTWVVKQFVSSFLTASQPQLVKYYGKGEKDNFNNLIFNISQYALFMFSVLAIPVFLEIDFVLNVWLTEVPKYTSIFIKLVLFFSIVSFANNMVDQGIVSIGRMKESSLYVTPIYLIVLPITYILFKLSFPPYYSYIIAGISTFLGFITNLIILRKAINFPAKRFFCLIFLKNTALILLSFIPPFLVQLSMPSSWLRLTVVCLFSVATTIIIMYNFSLSVDTRAMVKRKILGYVRK